MNREFSSFLEIKTVRGVVGRGGDRDLSQGLIPVSMEYRSSAPCLAPRTVSLKKIYHRARKIVYSREDACYKPRFY